MLMYKHFIYILIGICGFILFHQSVLAQDQRTLILSGIDKSYLPSPNLIDSSGAILASQKILKELYRSGYWLANIEQVISNPDTIFIQFHQGRKFDKVIYDLSNLDSIITTFNLDVSSVQYDFSVDRQVQDILTYFENSGHPFVSVVVDSSHLYDDDLFVKLDVDPGMYISYDTIKIEPKGILKDQFLSKYLGVEVGKYYDESVVQGIPLRLENLSFIRLNEVNNTFQLRKSKLTLDLKQKKVNYFDGILGFVPQDEEGQAEFTGELNLSVKNLFQSAKAIDIHWEKLTTNTQKLEASYLHPIFLGTPLDLFFDFEQLRQDTLFSNRTLQIGFQYYPLPRLKVSASYENKLGNELNDTSGQSGNFTIDNYNIGGTIWNLDKKSNPKQGVIFDTRVSLGRKETQNQTEEINSTQYALSANLKMYKKVMKKSVLYLGVSGALIDNQTLYLNDLYRVGGLYSIRGFDEGNFYASTYLYSNIEWRFYTDETSNIFLFYDQAYLEYNIVGGEFKDSPSGIGMGMQFMTNSGVFQLIYGLGRRDNQAFSFSASKIHFGYTALF